MNRLTIGRLKELIAGLPDDSVVLASGIEGPKAVSSGGSYEPKDGHFVLHLDSRDERMRGIGTYEIDPRAA
jgi:hypothetical protein